MNPNQLIIPRGTSEHHPMEDFLRMDRMPHIWCSTCGLGTVLTAFIAAVKETGMAREDIAVVSGIGCTGRAAGYLKFDSFYTTHGRALPYATGIKIGNPKLKVCVISGDGDLVSIGGKSSQEVLIFPVEVFWRTRETMTFAHGADRNYGGFHWFFFLWHVHSIFSVE